MRARWLLALLLLALALLAGRAVAAAYAERLWYAALGADALWRDRFWFTVLSRGISGLAAGAFVFINLYVVRRSVVLLVLPRRLANLEIGEEVPGRHLVLAALLIAIALGWILALPAESWRQLALVQHGVPFGETDPYFEADLGFFVYWLPLEGVLFVTALATALTTLVVVVFFYALTPSLRWERGGLRLSQYARRHVLALLAILLLILAWSFRLDQYGLLLVGSGPDGALTFADHRALLPSNGWMMLFAIGAAFMLLVLGWMGQMRAAAIALSALFVAGVGIHAIWPLALRWGPPAGDAAQREQPYLLSRAKYSRRAFALDQVAVADSGLRYASPAAAAAGVSSWDPRMLLAAAARRAHGEAAAVGWSAAGGALTALLPVHAAAAARDSVPPRWTVERALVSGADADGELVDLPAAADAGTALPGVLVYEGAPDALLVLADTLDLLPAPALTSSAARFAFGWSRERLGLLTDELPGPHPRAIIHRELRDRIAALAPFFVQGTVVTPALVADSLLWIVDLYAASQTYPLSRRDSLGRTEYGYVHHAATAVVNAHTGRVLLVRDDTLDPIATSWVRRYPSLFTPRPALSSEMLAALPPAIDGAWLQARVLAGFGRRGEEPPGGDLPAAPLDSLPAAARDGAFALPGGERVAWSVPVLDANKHLMGLVVAAGGPSRSVSWLPLTRAGPRWAAIPGRLKVALDSTTSPAPGAGSRRGGVRAVPVADGVMFVQSEFAVRPEAAPLLVRTAVLAGGTVASGRTIAQALGIRGASDDDAALTPAQFHARAAALYAQMRAAMQRGDWGAFGRAYEALGTLLARRERAP